ncbi:MAG: efflux RND transporter periplasmic adaptor subunit [Lachnospiraceae bacterium]|nr:efflux RND transporter periplasmic adaptor subunit [Lachnospiraceae bacterium]
MRKKKRIIIGAVAGVVTASLLLGGIVKYVSAATKVESYGVQKGSFENVIELNGTIQSNRIETFFSKANLKVDTVYAEVGDRVKAGDLLVSFSEEEIEYAIAMIELEEQMDDGSYAGSMEMDRRYRTLYNEAVASISDLNTRIAETEARIVELQKLLADRQAALASDGAKVQVSVLDSTDPTSKEYSEKQKQLVNNEYLQLHDEEIRKMQYEINALTVQLADLKENKAVMTSQKASSELALMSTGSKEEMEARAKCNELDREKRLAKLMDAKDGIRAEYDGVVTELNVTKGQIVGEDTPIFTLASTTDVVVHCQANKYDIMSIEVGQDMEVNAFNNTYTGKVIRVEGMVEGSGIGIDLSVDNPDESLILGYDVKAKINTITLDEVISVPRSALYEEDGKSYVYIEKEKKACRVNVETGVSNDSDVEIVTGLSEGDVVIWNEDKELKDGADVNVER